MKIRTGFVSNSSSSSFVCNYCGAVEAGYDMGLDEAGMIKFNCGHTVCEGHCEGTDLEEFKNTKDEIIEYIKEYYFSSGTTNNLKNNNTNNQNNKN